jgi:hypothetical protein
MMLVQLVLGKSCRGVPLRQKFNVEAQPDMSVGELKAELLRQHLPSAALGPADVGLYQHTQLLSDLTPLGRLMPVVGASAIHVELVEPEGFIFMSTTLTGAECLRRGLFGSPKGALPSMLSTISNKTQLFLINFDTSKVLGIFRATGPPRLNIEPSAWRESGGGRMFPAQVKVERLQVLQVSLRRPEYAKTGTFHAGPLSAIHTRDLLLKLGYFGAGKVSGSGQRPSVQPRLPPQPQRQPPPAAAHRGDSAAAARQKREEREMQAAIMASRADDATPPSQREMQAAITASMADETSSRSRSSAGGVVGGLAARAGVGGGGGAGGGGGWGAAEQSEEAVLLSQIAQVRGRTDRKGQCPSLIQPK